MGQPLRLVGMEVSLLLGPDATSFLKGKCSCHLDMTLHFLGWAAIWAIGLFGPDTTFITIYNVLKLGPDTIFIGKVSLLAIRVGLFGPEVHMFASWPLVFRQRPWALGLRAGFY